MEPSGQTLGSIVYPPWRKLRRLSEEVCDIHRSLVIFKIGSTYYFTTLSPSQPGVFGGRRRIKVKKQRLHQYSSQILPLFMFVFIRIQVLFVHLLQIHASTHFYHNPSFLTYQKIVQLLFQHSQLNQMHE